MIDVTAVILIGLSAIAIGLSVGLLWREMIRIDRWLTKLELDVRRLELSPGVAQREFDLDQLMERAKRIAAHGVNNGDHE
jgi:hypothetical protein